MAQKVINFFNGFFVTQDLILPQTPTLALSLAEGYG